MRGDCARAALARRLLAPGIAGRILRPSLSDHESIALAVDVAAARYDTGELYLAALTTGIEPLIASVEGQLRREAAGIGWRHYERVAS